MATVSHSVRETDRKVDDTVTVGKRTYFKQADFSTDKSSASTADRGRDRR
jgi:hypothetical protein